MIYNYINLQKPNFKAMIDYLNKELDSDHELVDKLISTLSKQNFGKELIPSGKDFLIKIQESGWISSDDPSPLYDLLESVNRHDIVHKAKLQALVQGMFFINFVLINYNASLYIHDRRCYRIRKTKRG